ncbi:hypothetical protein [Afifella pfennigii]|uniref:hypothetical protein n=1 Tax=Afifella pfennigii TaxID=209897 RepID=UPI00047CE2FA|nr:hypothetical protein [Afifella pfennigii]
MANATNRVLLAALLVAGASAMPAAAAEENFIDRFDGAWGGGGVVIEDEESGPTKVNCSLRGEGEGNEIKVSGRCRAYAIFSRKVAVNVRYQPGSGTYTGTYTGSPAGVARLSGKRRGDTVSLTLTWPKEVMGDTRASMSITNDGNGRVRVLVNDKVGKGPVKPITDLALANS